MKFQILTDGTIRTLYTEAVDLRRLGPLRIERATRIEFNHRTQHWEVLRPRGRRPLFSHPMRSRCLAWEQENL